MKRAERDTVVLQRFREMPKIVSYTDKMKREHDRKMQAEALRQKYRKAPKDGVAFACVVCVLLSSLFDLFNFLAQESALAKYSRLL